MERNERSDIIPLTNQNQITQKNQISDIRYHTPQKIIYQISDPPPPPNQISDTIPPKKNLISDIQVSPFDPPPPHKC